MSNAMQDASGMTSGGGAGDPDMFLAFMAYATNQATGLLTNATKRVGTMLGKVHKHRANHVVENLCKMKPNSEDE
eukprot:12898412-Ditylum_brightwellii.AAC.1